MSDADTRFAARVKSQYGARTESALQGVAKDITRNGSALENLDVDSRHQLTILTFSGSRLVDDDLALRAGR